MRAFVTGANGQLGYDVLRELKSRSYEGVGSGRGVAADTRMAYIPLDITDRAAVRDAMLRVRPDVVIHCAAWTAVDAAEEAENAASVYKVNVRATEDLAKLCREIGCKMMYISTDYVFDGQGDQPWKPDSLQRQPLNQYGKSKLAGEVAVTNVLTKYYIVRVSWTFGLNGTNFVKTMLRLGEAHPVLRVVDDQIGMPSYTRDLARLLVDMIETEQYGCYHATNTGAFVSWYAFACEIFKQAGYHTRVIPVSTEEYGASKAPRPRNSRLDCGKLSEKGFSLLPDWTDALTRFLKEYKESGLWDKFR